MTKEEAFAFVQAINNCQQFVPPLIFAQITSNPVGAQLAMVASGTLVCELKPTPAEPAAGASRKLKQ